MRLLALTVALAWPVAAQQQTTPDSAHHPHGDMIMEHGMMGPGMGDMMPMMMEGMEYNPAHLLALNGELSLSAQQITALTAIRDQAKRAQDAAMEKMKTHMDELHTALDAGVPDTNAIRMHFLAAHDAMGQAHLAMLVSSARAKAILTDAQRTQLSQMHHRMGMLRGREGPAGWRGRSRTQGF